YERVVDAPAPTLSRISMSQQDFDDIEKVWPLVLTPDELPKYDVKYVGREQVDEVGTYVFDIAPKKLEKSLRYLQGRIWVEDRDFQIVKTRGKADRKSTRLNSSHVSISYAVFCLKKKTK